MRRLVLALQAAVLAVLLLPAASGTASAQQAVPPVPILPPLPAVADPVAAFDGSGMWIWQLEESDGGDLARMTARAQEAGLAFVVVKAAHGARPWSQFSRALVDGLHLAGLRVCAYGRALGLRPEAEARALARATRAGADCLVVDAEAEYEGRRAEAVRYVDALRDAVGETFPVGLTSFPFADLHRSFPYEAFLGPRGAQVNLPQLYWGLIGTSVARTVARTWATNVAFGRPIRPIGQLFGGVRPAQVRAFRRLAAGRGATGVSWWAWQHARRQDWRAIRSAPSPRRVPPASAGSR